MNYVRKALLLQRPRTYYALMVLYSGYVVHRILQRSFMFFVTGVVLKALLLLVVPLLCVLAEGRRVEIRGPFSTPFVFNYSFENYHILRGKIRDLMDKFVKQAA